MVILDPQQIRLAALLACVVGLSGCGNPLGSLSTVSPDFHPGWNDNRDANAPVIVASDVVFSTASGTIETRDSADAPQIDAVAGLAHDFDRVNAPSGVTASTTKILAVDPEAFPSDCGPSCEVKELYFGFLSYIYGGDG